ncbi:ABC transporter substrate-binding protein [Chelatococcus reniformis]|uniref:Branched-chain amino acid ABC transporter substrate-binding protein n=1 Tax=Chelatococcus reniformis TaxID=1494448 RepID=A0A916UJ21_9HYPH|nr:ABC transporter substrate-binding protein [Chelatococcus reniformis]GGC74746.1 branched-chain amino acid ABC transporter substrate-binding protein [Chelatococcus reniformis]
MRMRSICLAAAAAGGLLASGSAMAQKRYDSGASDTEIKIGQNAPFSGPASAYSSFSRTMQAYFKMLNEKGGINGRKITLVALDDGYSPPKTVEVVRKLVEDDQVLAIVGPFGTPTNAAIQKYLNAKQVPQLLVQSGVSRWNEPKDFPWTTPYSPSYLNEGKNIAGFILKQNPSARIGLFMQSDDIGKEYAKGVREALGDKANTMIVKETSYQVTDSTVDSQMLALKNAGADVVLVGAQNKFAAQAVRKIHELGWKPLVILPSISNSVAGVLEPAGLEAAVGVVTTSPYKTPSDPTWANDPGMRDYLAFMKSYLPSDKPDDIIAVTGYSTAQAAAEILKRSGDDLTRANVLKQATHLEGLSLPLLLPGIVFQASGGGYPTLEETRFARFDGKTWVLFGSGTAAR